MPLSILERHSWHSILKTDRFCLKSLVSMATGSKSDRFRLKWLCGAGRSVCNPVQSGQIPSGSVWSLIGSVRRLPTRGCGLSWRSLFTFCVPLHNVFWLLIERTEVNFPTLGLIAESPTTIHVHRLPWQCSMLFKSPPSLPFIWFCYCYIYILCVDIIYQSFYYWWVESYIIIIILYVYINFLCYIITFECWVAVSY